MGEFARVESIDALKKFRAALCKFAETVRQVQAYQVVRASGGAEATPAGWMPGDLVLKPGPDLVGNVWKVWKPEMEK